MIELYPHQEQFVSDLRASLRKHQSVLAVAPTGMGKTVVAAYMALSAASKNKRVTFTVHRRDLITQTAKTFDQFDIPYGYVAAGYPYNPHMPVQIASVDTLRNRMARAACDLLVVDEAHLGLSAGWAKMIAHFSAAGSKIIGLTGSPTRLDGRSFDSHFSDMVQGPTTGWLIERGFLSTYRAFAPPPPSMAGVHTRMGDFVQAESEAVMNTKSVTGDAVSHWLRHARGKRTVVFCVSVKHSQHVAEQFRAAGVMAVHMDGSTHQADRQAAIRAFANGDISVLTNCNLFCEGFDLSAQVGRDVPIEAIVLLRPTQSLALHLQQCGRVLRRKPQPAIILDHAGNLARLGLPDDDREWKLEAETKKKKAAGGESGPPVRQCPKCYAAHAPRPKCPECGHVYVIEAREPELVDADLVEVDLDAARMRRVVENRAAESIAELIRIGKERGYAKATHWAAHYHKARKGANATLGELIAYAAAEGKPDPQKWAAGIMSAVLRR